MKWNEIIDIAAQIATILGLPIAAWSAWKTQKEASTIRQAWQMQNQQIQNVEVRVVTNYPPLTGQLQSCQKSASEAPPYPFFEQDSAAAQDSNPSASEKDLP